MPVKRYGIYVAYPPQVDLRFEGLGRHLAELLKAAQGQEDLRFVIACPSWVRSSLYDLCRANNIDRDSFEVVSPKSEPVFLQIYRIWLNFRNRQRRGRLKALISALSRQGKTATRLITKTLVSTRSLPVVLLVGAGALLLTALAFPFLVAIQILRAGSRWASKLISRASLPLRNVVSLSLLSRQPHHSALIRRLYRLMEDSEAAMLARLAESRADVRAWFAPTAFWPQFNAIKRPRLMCVPDVHFTQFPVGFGTADGRLMATFRQIESSIKACPHLVTYSEDVKWRTLVDHFHLDASRIDVVRHGANIIDDLITVKGTPDDTAATLALCRDLFISALRKAINAEGSPADRSDLFPFLFYPTQFRPSKNVINLLRSYKYLLKQRHLGIKLILTGRPEVMPEMSEFLDTHNLRNDVLCLHGLTNQEWAACYKLATLAVNPSLAEGGFPFTFSEALSVGTPVVMSRIAVTEEVMNDPEIQEMTFFDPYDWKDMASRIEWAICNREELYNKQQKFYDDVVSRRTWQHVVEDYVRILDRVSKPDESGECLVKRAHG
ncbi:glycosyltransferase [Bradyrhizobium liaoningense]|uniref:glycosyltransferase n=1 Tax=Bradyrhizobium liaoningense TaxID=43992 RepID=UPI001BA6C4ED|nr:glycosyltransferase [Bradyrhizobium liaoningense]MBR1033812.1 glycosyltransferase [Bradyrhizobium liaoningense]